MPVPQTPVVQSGTRRQVKRKRSLYSKNTLNISRKLLEKSGMCVLFVICFEFQVVQQNQRIESIQQNNIQLAKRVCDLQKELSDRNAELQTAREDVFQLEVKLNRLQNSSYEVKRSHQF